MADEERLRQEAVKRHLRGERSVTISTELGRTERWVFKWINRYEAGDRAWFESSSRAPAARPSSTDEETVELVLAARDRLEADPRAQRGAAAIAWELVRAGVPEDELPPMRTIERIVARAGRSKPRQCTTGRYVPKGTPYPFRVSRAGVGALHELDPAGPRYLDGGIEVYSLNLIDVGSHRVALGPLKHPTPKAYAGALMAAWERLGIPDVLQLDNHQSLRGDIANPRVFGPVVRVCLARGVRLRYIPLSEPWRNGVVERFQDVFMQSFFRAERFDGFRNFARRAGAFEVFHNAQHRYTALKGRTPDQAFAASGILVRQPSAGFTIPSTLPKQGHIEAVRLIRSDRILNLFGEHFEMPEETIHQYVVATIFVRTKRLVVTYRGVVIHEAEHPIR